MKTVLVLHGPNLNLLGIREPEVYGHLSLTDLDERIRAVAATLGLAVESAQSNHEGHLIDRLQDARGRVDGVILNPGGLTHTSVSLRDAVAALDIPVVEVHLSNPMAREPFRHEDRIAPVVWGVVSGMGTISYLAALFALHRRFEDGA